MKPHFSKPLLVIVLALVSALFLFPLFWIALTAIKPSSEIFTRSLHLLPSHVEWSNIARAWTVFHFAPWLVNSLVLSFLGGSLSLILDLLAGYAFAKFQFPAREPLFVLFLCTLMLPTQVFVVPQFMTVAALGGINTWWAAILPKAAETYGVFLARQFFSNIPDPLLDAARLDGANEWQIFFRIVLPLSKPAIAVLSVLLVLGIWNDFGWPLVILKDERSMTLPLGLSMLQGEHVPDWSSIMVIVLCSVLPVTVLFVALQPYFVRGIARSGLK